MARRALVLLGLAALAALGFAWGRVTAQRALITPDEINTVEVRSGAVRAVVRVDVRLDKTKLQPGDPFIDTGSGFFYKPNLIVTNYHVIQDQAGITVRLYDGRIAAAKIEGVDPGIDIAILRVSGVSAPKTLTFGSSARLIPGQRFIVIGTPLGNYQNFVSTGVYSTSTEENLPREDNLGAEVGQYLLTDALIQQGNSGGPVLNSRGEVVGVADANVASNNFAPAVIGVAVPSDLVAESVQDLERVGVPQRGTLGVTFVDLTELAPALRRAVGLTSSEGALVQDVPAGTTGARANLRGSVSNAQGQLVTLGDVILAVDGRRVKNQYDVIRLIAAKRPGQTVVLRLWRNRREVNLRVPLQKRTLN